MPNKILSADGIISFGKILAAAIIAAFVAALTLATFYFTRESDQNERIIKVTTSLDNHTQQAKETFEDLNTTMREQRQHNVKMSNSLAEVTAVQQILKEEDERLCRKIEDLEAKIKDE